MSTANCHNKTTQRGLCACKSPWAFAIPRARSRISEPDTALWLQLVGQTHRAHPTGGWRLPRRPGGTATGMPRTCMHRPTARLARGACLRHTNMTIRPLEPQSVPNDQSRSPCHSLLARAPSKLQLQSAMNPHADVARSHDWCCGCDLQYQPCALSLR